MFALNNRKNVISTNNYSLSEAYIYFIHQGLGGKMDLKSFLIGLTTNDVDQI